MVTEKKIKKLEDGSNKIQSSVLGLDSDDFEHRKELEKIMGKITSVKKEYSLGGDENVLEFLAKNSMKYFKESRINRKNKIDNTKSSIDEIFEGSLSGQNISRMFNTESDRLKGYSNYEVVVNLIPILKEILKTYTDNTMNPDDFKNSLLNITLKDTSGSNNKEDIVKNTFIPNIEKLEEIYNLENKIKSYTENALWMGDTFVYIKKIGESLESLMKKREKIRVVNEEFNIFNESVLEKEYIEELDNLLFREIDVNPDKLKKKEKKELLSPIKTDMLKLVEDAVVLNEDSLEIIGKDDLKLLTRLQNKHKIQVINESMENGKTEADINVNDLSFINGSIIKKLDPSKVIKLEFNGIVYGFYYFENVNQSGLNKINTFSSISLDIKKIVDNVNGIDKRDGKSAREKEEFIYNTIGELIVEKIDRKFIIKNTDFKRVINSFLKSENSLKSTGRLKVTFIPPNEMVHFMPNEEDGIYGESIFKYIMFFAKIYLVTLLTQLMMKITRSADKRMWHLETGLENDQEAVVSSFINDIKNNEIRIGDFDNIDYVMKSLGQFKDYYLPVFDGEKPVEMETMEGQESEMNNEFLEFLNKHMVSGSGLPAAFIESIEEIELAKTLSLLNQKFARRIISIQKSLQKPATKFIRILYENEFESKDEIDVKAIMCTFKLPLSLSLTNLEEEISKVDTISESIAGALIPDGVEKVLHGVLIDDDNRDGIKATIQAKIREDLIPNLPWKKSEELLEGILLAIVKQSEEVANKKKEKEDAEAAANDDGI